MFKKLFSLVAIFVMGAALTMKADTIGPGASCSSCMGSSYTLTYSSLGSNQYDVLLSIDTSGFTGPAGSFLNSVAFKLTPQSNDITSILTVQQPATFGAIAASGLNASGCAGGSGGYYCTESSGNGVAVGGVYNFEYKITTTDLMLGSGADSVKALYVNSNGQQDGITSEAITLTPVAPTPEPSSMVLLATGLLSAAGAVRRRIKAKV